MTIEEVKQKKKALEVTMVSLFNQFRLMFGNIGKTIKKLLGGKQKAHTVQDFPPPRPKVELKSSPSYRHPCKGRTPGAFGSCRWLKIKDDSKFKTRAAIGKMSDERRREERQRRKKIRRAIECQG